MLETTMQTPDGELQATRASAGPLLRWRRWGRGCRRGGRRPDTCETMGSPSSGKRCARKFQVLWIVIAHPAKLKQGDTITLYSISDSAHWSNKSDIGLVIIRPADDGDAELRVAKVRYEEIRRGGSVKIKFNPETRRFHVPVEVFK
jgi:hypothetical protein